MTSDTRPLTEDEPRHGVITYDDHDEWLIEDGAEETAQIVARQVPRWFGRLVVDALRDTPVADTAEPERTRLRAALIHVITRRHKFTPTCDGCWWARELVRDSMALDVEPVVGNCPECDAPIGDGVPGCVHWPATPVADTAGWPELANDIRAVDGNHDLGAGALAEALTGRGWRKADTAGIDAAWREAEAALPEGWALALHRHKDGSALAGARSTAYRAGKGELGVAQRIAVVRGPFGGSARTSGPTPAAALLALAAALRTPKPEGEPE